MRVSHTKQLYSSRTKRRQPGAALLAKYEYALKLTQVSMIIQPQLYVLNVNVNKIKQKPPITKNIDTSLQTDCHNVYSS